jgi:FkbM family methyltransferase
MRVITPEIESLLSEQFFGHAQSGYFVEVGANDPRIGSQTWRLEQAGWEGVLVEPQPDLADELRQRRRAHVFAVACSSPANAGRVMPFYVAGWMSALDRERMAPGAAPHDVIAVPVMTLDQILHEAQAPERIDFVSIDVEGHELEVLEGFDLARWRPRLILVEDHVGNLKKLRFLRRAGYRLIRHSQFNGWYIPRGTPVDIPWQDRWRILRKYYLALPFRMTRDALRRLRGRFAARPATAPNSSGAEAASVRRRACRS